MPFETVETTNGAAARDPMAKLSYLRGRGEAAKKRKPALKITVPTTICGLSKAEAFVLLVGSGQDKGKIRITASDKGVKPGMLKHYFNFRFGHVPLLGDDIFDGESRPVRKINDDTFEIDAGELFPDPKDVILPSNPPAGKTTTKPR